MDVHVRSTNADPQGCAYDAAGGHHYAFSPLISGQEAQSSALLPNNQARLLISALMWRGCWSDTTVICNTAAL